MIEIIGDPHLGRRFENGVALHRRGDREASVWRTFEEALEAECDMSVCVGDIFDKPFVPLPVILKASRAYKSIAARRPNTEFIVIRGNHDASKDRLIVSAYEVFSDLMENVKNVHVLGDEPLALAGYLFLPFHPFKSAAELVPISGSYTACWGHYDVIDFQNGNPNLIPLEKLKAITPVVYTGHDHNKREIFDGFVHVTGSMQPYSHAEDAEGKLYVTCTLDSIPDDISGKCLRLLLRPGEVPPPDLDCLQLTIKRVGDDEEPVPVQLDTFDLKNIFDDTMTESGVGPDLRSNLWERMKQ